MYSHPFMEMLSFMVITLFIIFVIWIMNIFIILAPSPKLTLHDNIDAMATRRFLRDLEDRRALCRIQCKARVLLSPEVF